MKFQLQNLPYKTLFSFLCLISFSVHGYGQSSLVSRAKLQSVEIYGRGAALQHSVEKVSVPQGNSALVIVQVAKEVNANSIRVNTSNPHITIESISFEKNYLNEEKGGSPQFKELKASFEKEKKKLEDITHERKGEEGVLALLEENKKVGGSAGATPAKIQEMMGFYRSENKKLRANIEALVKQEKEQKDKVDKMQLQLNQLGTESQETGQLFLKIYAAQATTSDFEVQYFTNAVSWQPFYELRVKSLNEPMNLSYKANLTQNTGLDWQQVRLAFSSANPNQNNNAPKLNPWRLSFRGESSTPFQVTGARQQMMAKAYSADAVADNAAVEEMAIVQSNELSNSFVVQKPYNIYSGSQAQAVELQEYKLPASYTYYSAPKYDNTAFLIGKVTDWEQYNLLPGNANLLIENNYAGTSYINPNTTDDTLTFSLGRDDRIQIERKMIDQEGSATKFLGKTRKREYTYEITVRNTRNESIALEVVDQYPISNEKDMEIQLLETSGAVIDKKEGRLVWNLNLAGKETKVLKLSYSVSYPKDKIVNGL